MMIQFPILGLIIIFLLVIFYFYHKNPTFQNSSLYPYLLLISYILMLVEVALFIAFRVKEQELFYGKIFLILILSLYAGFTCYYIAMYLKEKYPNQETTYLKKISQVKRGYGITLVCHALIIAFSKFTLEGKTLIDHAPIFSYLIILYVIIGFITLIIGSHYLKPQKNYHLWIVYWISAIAVWGQFAFPNLPLLSTGIIIMMFYLYLTIENMGIEELETLRLEKEYNAKQNINKVAFLKNLSHEIRTPLNTIDGFSQIMETSADMDEIKQDAADIRLASRDLIDVINGMIDLSIIESGNLEIISENYNVYDMFDNIVEIAKSKVRDKDIKFIFDIDNNIPEVLWGDSERISQVIFNLLKNAIKFTEKGTISLKVSKVKSDNICRLRIEVKDTGKGMTKEELDNLFQPNSLDKNRGIDLLVSKYLIELMKGSLEVESTDQEGSLFTVIIDQKIISEVQEKKERKEKVLRPFSAKDKRILIVDDNKLNLKVARRMLEPYEVEITEADSGEECLNILEKDTHFDLILMDDLMPGLSGTETMELLKKIQRVDGYYIPIVVVTANATNGQKEKYLDSGFEDYLSKPIDRYELNTILKKYLKGRNLSK